MSVKKISILGATGSIGDSTASVILSCPEKFDVQIVSANGDAQALAARAKALNARHAVIADPAAYGQLREYLAGSGIETSAGRQALLDAAGASCDLVVAAITGFAGLEPLMKAIEAGAHIALANKEPLVAAGPQVMAAAEKRRCALLPVDSEHNAVFQVFDEKNRQSVARIILTASGGPFRTWTKDAMARATPAQAVAHPNWSMGAKISVDSATMMNKALEVAEAHYLFSLPPEKIDVVVHPQSLIHSMVEYEDGSILSQMGAPDMRTPLAFCLGWPERMAGPAARIDFGKPIKMELEPVDADRFPAIGMAYDCLRAGQAACVALNAANEIAVHAFLAGRIGFPDICSLVARVLETGPDQDLKTVEDVVLFDAAMRTLAKSYIDKGITGKEARRA